MQEADRVAPLLMMDVEGCALSGEDRQLLAHPAVGGLILFSRNFDNRDQLIELVKQIRTVKPQMLIAVDQEGGRVQRFRNGFTRLPPMSSLGMLHDEDEAAALDAAYWTGRLMAEELRLCDVDISFAPVLDLDYGISEVIGDRSFHAEPVVAVRLIRRFIQGMKQAGMAATGKHFPGHGGVGADSHLELPVDSRPEQEIRQCDLLPFQQLANELAGIMPAHVLYSQVDSQPAGFSRFWLQDVLRGELGFSGVIFSDDLAMEGAAVAGPDYADRANAALRAGCDMVLVCNDRTGAEKVIDWLENQADLPGQHKVPAQSLCGTSFVPMTGSEQEQAQSWIRRLNEMAG